jgi:hypothetical protein
LDELIEKLDALPGRVGERSVHPLKYSGLARRLEDERITRDTLDGLPERIRGLYGPVFSMWRSEREWMDFVRTEDETPEKIWLSLDLNDSDIDRVESMSCDEIVAYLEERTRAAYAAIPSPVELCERYGDPSNTRIYMFQEDMERKWLDLHLKKDPVVFDRELTHLRP